MDDTRHNLTALHRFSFYSLFALILLGVTLYPTILQLFNRWTRWDESLSHGLLVITLFIYFFCTRNPAPSKFLGKASWKLAPFGLFLSLLIWAVAAVIHIDIIEELSLLPIIFFTLATLSNFSIAIARLPIILLVIFALPIWDYLVPYLVTISSFIISTLVGLLHIPVMVNVNTLTIPSGEIIISDGCSGIRYLVISLTLSYLLCLLNRYTLKKQVCVILIGLGIGLLANWIRIFILVLVGYYTEMQHPLIQDHEYFGWILFSLIIFPFLYFAPVVHQNKLPLTPIILNKKKLLITVALLIGTSVSVAFLDRTSSSYASMKDRLSISYQPISKYRNPIIFSSENTTLQEFATKNNVVIQIDYYQKNSIYKKLVPYLPSMPKAEGWSIEQYHKYSSTNLAANQIYWRNKFTQKTAISFHWYQLGNNHTENIWKAKLLQIPASWKGLTEFRSISLAIICDQNCSSLEEENLINEAKTLKNQL